MINKRKILVIIIFIILLFFVIGEVSNRSFFRSTSLVTKNQTSNVSMESAFQTLSLKMVDVLKLPNWKISENLGPNLKIEKSVLTVDNTYGRIKDGFFNFVNRADVFTIGEEVGVSLQLNKTAGKEVSVNLIAALPKEEKNWFSPTRWLEIYLGDNENGENLLYLKFFDTEKGIQQNFFAGPLPIDGKISVKIIGDKIFVFDSQNNLLGGKIILKEKLFKGQLAFGFSAGPNSILKVYQFLVRLSPTPQL